MTEKKEQEFLTFTSGGFELYVPPSPLQSTPRFVMLDDLNNVFYDVDYETSTLKNTTSWSDLALHTVPAPAIAFRLDQLDLMMQNPTKAMMKGFLVAITTWDSGTITAKKIGSVFVKRLDPKFMNWSVLKDWRGSELPAEMKAGLLRRVFDKRPEAHAQMMSYVTPSSTLARMSVPWHRDGHALNHMLQERFAGGQTIARDQTWKLYV